MGDRNVDEMDFGRIQRDRIREIEDWVKVGKMLNNKKVKFGVVAAKDYYVGFGPATANTISKMVGLTEAVWEEKKQATLSNLR